MFNPSNQSNNPRQVFYDSAGLRIRVYLRNTDDDLHHHHLHWLYLSGEAEEFREQITSQTPLPLVVVLVGAKEFLPRLINRAKRVQTDQTH